MTTAVAPAATPPQWHTVYVGDKECRFFKALSRGRDKNQTPLEWRTTKGLMKATKLSQKEIEAIILKYLATGVVEQHSKEAGKFRYWKNATKKKKLVSSLSDSDKKRRVDESLVPTP